MIISLNWLHLSLLRNVNFSMEILFGVEPVPVLRSNVRSIQDWLGLPSGPVPIRAVLPISAILVLQLPSFNKLVAFSVERVGNGPRIFIGSLISGPPVFLSQRNVTFQLG